MANQLVPIITDAGREALMSGFSTAENFRFSHVALGNGDGDGYAPLPDQIRLKNEIQRVDVASVVIQDHARLHITAVVGTPQDQDTEEYSIHEIGFFLQGIEKNGSEQGEPLLFAIYATESGENPLLSKDPATELMLAFDLVLPDIVEGELKFDKDSYLHLPESTETGAGLLQIATKKEALAGTDAKKAVTPLTLKSALDALTKNQSKDEIPLDNAKIKTTLTVGDKKTGSVEIGKSSVNSKKIYFNDKGEIESHDPNHRILFRRDENILELREFGKIILSTGVKDGTSTESAILNPNGDLEIKGTLKAKGFHARTYNENQHRMYPSTPLVYDDIHEAKKAGKIERRGKSKLYDDTKHTKGKEWQGKTLIRYGGDTEAGKNGAILNVPKGYDTAWVRVLGDRWTVMSAFYVDGKKEALGQWAGGYRANNSYCPDGSLADGRIGNSKGKAIDITILRHQWLPIPVPRSGKLALKIQKNTTQNFWLSGVAFSKNPWAHATQNAVAMHWGLNKGEPISWESHTYHYDVLAKIDDGTKKTLMVPVVPNGQDKLLYFVNHNPEWNGCMHNGIIVNGKPVERLLATYDNPFARHINSKPYSRYIATRIPASLIKSGESWMKVQVDLSTVNSHFYFREAGTHDLMVPE